MHSTVPKYTRPGISIGEPKSNFEYWDLACGKHEEGKHRDSLAALLNFVNPNLLDGKFSMPDCLEVEEAHGSASVRISIDSTRLRIVAPFLGVGGANIVPLLRRVAEVNFRPLTLTEIVLKDDVLSFQFETPIELCHPRKIYDVLREICFFADEYDDQFIKQYGASFCREPKIIPLDDEEKTALQERLAEIAEEYRRYLGFFEKRLDESLKWNIVAITLLKVANIPTIQGSIRSSLNGRIQANYDPSIDPRVRSDAGKRFLDELFEDMQRDGFFDNVYHAKKLVSLKTPGSIPLLQREFESERERIDSHINGGDVYGAAFLLQHLLIRVLHEYNLEDAHEDLINDCLELSGGKETGEALDLMKGVFECFAAGTPERSRLKKRGFFARLFG